MVGNYIVSFIGFMPADDPEIVLYVAVDHPKGVSQYGGTVAAPLFKAIMQSYIDIKKLEPTNSGMPKVYNYLDVKYYPLPDVIGKSLEEAKKILKDYKLEYSGSGNKIIYQSPNPNLYVEENSVVKLMLGE